MNSNLQVKCRKVSLSFSLSMRVCVRVPLYSAQISNQFFYLWASYLIVTLAIFPKLLWQHENHSNGKWKRILIYSNIGPKSLPKSEERWKPAHTHTILSNSHMFLEGSIYIIERLPRQQSQNRWFIDSKCEEQTCFFNWMKSKFFIPKNKCASYK